jgi:hypothetical protein
MVTRNPDDGDPRYALTILSARRLS